MLLGILDDGRTNLLNNIAPVQRRDEFDLLSCAIDPPWPPHPSGHSLASPVTAARIGCTGDRLDLPSTDHR